MAKPDISDIATNLKTQEAWLDEAAKDFLLISPMIKVLLLNCRPHDALDQFNKLPAATTLLLLKEAGLSPKVRKRAAILHKHQLALSKLINNA